MAILPLVFIAAFLFLSHKVAAVNRTWDGGGTTTNWSEAANWSGDTAPGPFDVAVFDGTSSKNATIDTSIDVAGIQIGAGYTATITQAAGVNINVGNFGSYSQAGGTFNGGNGSFAIAFDFTLSGGTFNAPTGTLSVGDNFTHTSGGTFNNNSGTVSFTGTGGTINVATSETFNNLSWNLINGFSLSIPVDDTLIVTGSLVLNDGAMQGGGTVEARAGLTVGPNFDGVTAGAVTLLITPGDGSPRTLTFNAGAKLPGVNLNAANVTINTAGAGTIDFLFQTLTLQAGTIQQGSVGLTVAAYTQSGGTFTGGSGLLTVTNPGGGGNLTLVAGTFTGGSGDIDVRGTFTVSGGTFTSTTGTLSVGSFTHNAGTFNHNSGTVAFTGSGPTLNVPTSETFNHVTFNTTNGFSFTIAAGKTLIAIGNLTFNTGLLGGNGTIEARANVTVGPSFGGAASGTPTILFSGSADQTFTNNGGVNPGGIWTVDKPEGELTLLSDLILQTTQPLNFTAGVFNQGAAGSLTVGTLTVGAAGIYRNFGTGDLTLGGNVSNAGTIEIDGGGPACGDADSILIRSSASGSQRLWTGGGTFRLQDVNVQDQAGNAAITVFNGTDAGNNGANWTFSAGCAPTEVTLVSFTATDCADGRVLLRWQTGYETDNLGFRLYRDQAGKRVMVNSQIIAGSALTASSTLLAGQSYAYWDDAPAANAGYWLEDLDLKGDSTWHGPFFVSPQKESQSPRAPAALLSELVRPQAEATAPVEIRSTPARVSAEPVKQQAALASQFAVKIAVAREGWYHVSPAQLADVGFDPRTDPRRLQLFVDGREVPILVRGETDGSFDPQDAVEFYGTGLDSPYTDARVYWLVAGTQPGLRIQRIESEAAISAPPSFTETVERRDRTVYFSSLRNGERENFFGAVVMHSPVEQTLSLEHVAAGDAVLEVALQGVTLAPHRVAVELNSVAIGDVVFDDQSPAVARFNIPQAILREGQNRVRLAAASSQGDVSLVDSIRLSYQRLYIADNDLLRFTAPANQSVTVSGFSSAAIRVVDVTNGDAPQELVGTIKESADGYRVSCVTPENGERRLIAFTSPPPPARLSLHRPMSLRKGKADYLIITRRDFFDSLKPLVSLRKSQGLAVALVDIEDIYDEFSFGQKSPDAVRAFLSLASSNWKKKPRLVLFAGDASYDPKDHLGLGDFDLVPTKLIDTEFMETACDDWLSDFDDDGIADMATGRLPARSANELRLLIAKLIAYESDSASEDALLVADRNDGFDFEGANQSLLPLIRGHLRVTQVNRDRIADAEAKRLLIDDIHRKQMIVTYAGHGSVNLWRGNLLTNEDALALRNPHLPLFVLMTCLNGYFDDPALDSLAEALLKAEGGAIAVWASSGKTLPAEQAVLNQELYRQLFDQAQALTLGEAVRRAKTAAGSPDIRRTWILLGDPAMRLK